MALLVRTAHFDTIASGHADEPLTTGEAAALPGSSRQHVVDLCARGELSFTTTGKHRRVRRGEVEVMRARTQRLTRAEVLSRSESGALRLRMLPGSASSHPEFLTRRQPAAT